MPNWITTIIETDSPAVLTALRTPEMLVDFNRVIPFPAELEGITAEALTFDTQEEADAYQARQEEAARKWPAAFRPETPQRYALTRAEAAVLWAKYGSLHWYAWNTENWNTKWNATRPTNEANYRVTDGQAVQFETAWAHPEPVVRKLSEMFPDDLLTVHYADEDLGSNYGSYTIQNGEVQSTPIDEAANKAAGRGYVEVRDFCCKVLTGRTYAEEYADDED